MDAKRDAFQLDESQARALALLARHVNASTSVAIPDRLLLSALRTGIVPPGYEHHIFAALDETDTATLADLAIAGAVSYGDLAALADRLLPDGHSNRVWLDDRR